MVAVAGESRQQNLAPNPHEARRACFAEPPQHEKGSSSGVTPALYSHTRTGGPFGRGVADTEDNLGGRVATQQVLEHKAAREIRCCCVSLGEVDPVNEVVRCLGFAVGDTYPVLEVIVGYILAHVIRFVPEQCEGL